MPAAAFDCSRASTDVEKAICSSPEAIAVDERMAEAYRELTASLPADEARTLRDSQRQWIQSRENLCGWREPAERTQCVFDEIDKRRRILSGLPKAGPGTGSARLRPLMIARKGDAKTYSIDISAVIFAEPLSAGEHAFNRAIKGLYADAPLHENIDFESPGQLTYTLSVELTYASPGFISALASGGRYDGGAHGNSWTSAVNVDLKAGRVLTFADLFPASARPAFARLCRDQVIAQKRDKMNESAAAAASDLKEYQSTIDEYVGDLSRWSFGARAVDMTFDPYAVGSYAEGEYTCRLDNRVVDLYANPDVAIPR